MLRKSVRNKEKINETRINSLKVHPVRNTNGQKSCKTLFAFEPEDKVATKVDIFVLNITNDIFYFSTSKEHFCHMKNDNV